MSEVNEGAGNGSSQNAVVAAFVAAQNAVVDAMEKAKALLELCHVHRDIKAITAATSISHKLEKLQLETIKNCDKIMDPAGK